MIKIETLTPVYFSSFKELFCDYFIKDFQITMDRDTIQEKVVEDQIIKQFSKRVIDIDIATNMEVMIGFIIYQIDTDKSDWNERPGEGFIREQYVCPHWRKKGIGSQLLHHAEEKLKQQGVRSVYLTSNDNEGTQAFYQSNGYAPENKQCQFNSLGYFSKSI